MVFVEGQFFSWKKNSSYGIFWDEEESSLLTLAYFYKRLVMVFFLEIMLEEGAQQPSSHLVLSVRLHSHLS